MLALAFFPLRLTSLNVNSSIEVNYTHLFIVITNANADTHCE